MIDQIDIHQPQLNMFSSAIRKCISFLSRIERTLNSASSSPLTQLGSAVPNSRGFLGIGTVNLRQPFNYGAILRSSHAFGANFCFSIHENGLSNNLKKYIENVDTSKASRHVPLFTFSSTQDFFQNLPHDCKVVSVEIDPRAKSILEFEHPNNDIDEQN